MNVCPYAPFHLICYVFPTDFAMSKERNTNLKKRRMRIIKNSINDTKLDWKFDT